MHAITVIINERFFKMYREYPIFDLRMLRVMVIMFVAALIVTFTVSSCSSEIVEVPVDRIVEKEVIKEVEVTKVVTVEIEKDPGELVLYSGRKESLVGPIVEQFEDATRKFLNQ